MHLKYLVENVIALNVTLFIKFAYCSTNIEELRNKPN